MVESQREVPTKINLSELYCPFRRRKEGLSSIFRAERSDWDQFREFQVRFKGSVEVSPLGGPRKNFGNEFLI